MHKKHMRSILTLLLVAVLILPFFATTVSAEYENTYTNTGNMRNDIIGVALTQVGYEEGDNNYTKYGVWYGQPNSPWCGMFVSWCAKEAGVPTSILKRTGIANPSNFGLSYQSGNDYIPQKGDLFFKTNFSHVGLVYYTEGEYFYTVEGNTSTTSAEGTSVMIRKRKISEFYFSSPNYTDSTCNHSNVTKTEDEHPHREYKVCTKCNYKAYTGKKNTSSTCKACIQDACKHTFSSWKKISNTMHNRVCSKCDYEEAKAHNWKTGEIIKEAKCTENGQQQMLCSDCNAETTKELKATGTHKYTDYSYLDENEHQIVCEECEEQSTSPHTLSSEWKYDSIYHWTSCKDCGGRICHYEHNFENGCSAPCKDCGYTVKGGHKGNGEKLSDAVSHWETCSYCGEPTAEAAHSYVSDCDETCDDCGYKRVVSSEHSDSYLSDDAGHWRECSVCERQTATVPHSADQNAEEWETLVCTHCGYELRSSERHEHTLADVQYDKTSHWGNCCCGEKIEPELHAWDIQSGACNICGIKNETTEAFSLLDFLISLWHRIWSR